jgi:hypothetical protein
LTVVGNNDGACGALADTLSAATATTIRGGLKKLDSRRPTRTDALVILFLQKVYLGESAESAFFGDTTPIS